MRIQNQLNNVDTKQERRIEEKNRREARHLQSKEVVKLWANTKAGQRQKTLEAKTIRKQIEEKKRQQLDIEEAKYKEEKRKEALEKAKTQLAYQTDKYKGLHSAYLLSRVLKEREEQIEYKQCIKNIAKDGDKTFLEAAKAREDEYKRQEEEKVRQKKEQTLTFVKELKNQIKENELEKEHKKKLRQQETERTQQIYELQFSKQNKKQERKQEVRDLHMKAHQEHLANKKLEKIRNAQKEQMEEEKRKLFLSEKEKREMLWRDKEEEIKRQSQIQRERVLEQYVNNQQERAKNEELKVVRAVAEWEARVAQMQLKDRERKAAMLESMAVHRKSIRQENERLKEKIKQEHEEMLRSIKETNKIYAEKQHQMAEKKKEEEKSLQEFHRKQIHEKHLQKQQQMQVMKEFEAMNTQKLAQEEYQFKLYAKDIIHTAQEAKLNVVPLYRAAYGVRPSCAIQGSSGAQMPDYVSGPTHNVKIQNWKVNFERSKRRLGFT
ncbi:cilia- and flagella- associated protein 210-like [Eucyclogobius newberryi]|uniref:cilia- and flagella- associated protein 210-like n=1 Tax=Eucyclogobius newberryi TaxID=166745 RepID=UPI003B5C24C5